MYFRRIANVKFNIISFPECITKIQEAKFCFEFKPDPHTNKIVGITGCIKTCMGYARVRKTKKIRINSYKITVFCGKYCIPVSVNTFFIKAPE